MNDNNIKKLRETLVQNGYLDEKVDLETFQGKLSDEGFRNQFRETLVSNGYLSEQVDASKFDQTLGLGEDMGPESLFEGTEYSSIDEVQSRVQEIETELAPKESFLGKLGFTGLGSTEDFAPEKAAELKEEKESLDGLLEQYEERLLNHPDLSSPENYPSPEDYLEARDKVQTEYEDIEGTEKKEVDKLQETAKTYEGNSWFGYLRVGLRGLSASSAGERARNLSSEVIEEVSKPQQMAEQSETIKLTTYGAALADSYNNTEEELKESYGEDNYLAFQKILSFANQTQQEILNPETGELDIPAELYKKLPQDFNIMKVSSLAKDPRLEKMQKVYARAKETSEKVQGLDEKYPLVKAVQDIAKEDSKKIDDLYRKSNWIGKSYLNLSTVMWDTPKSIAGDIAETGMSLYGLVNPEVGKAYFTGKGMERVPDVGDFTTSKQKRPIRERVVNHEGYIVGVDDKGEFKALYDEDGYPVDVPSNDFVRQFNESGKGKDAEKVINGSSLVSNGLRTARDVAITMAYTGGIGAATKLSAANAIVPSVMFQYQNDFLEEGVQAGMDFRTSYGMGALRGLKSGLINRINPLEAGTVTNYLNRGVGRANVESLKGAVSSASKNKNALFTWLSQMGGEQVEEFMDEFTDVQLMKLMDANMEGVNHDAHFDPIEVGLLTAFATMGPATIATLGNYNQMESDDFYQESVFKAASDFDKYQKVVADLREKEQISPEDAEFQLNRIKRIRDNYAEYLGEDSPLTEGQKLDLANAADQVFILEEKLSKLPNTDNDLAKEAEEKLNNAKEVSETIILAKESGELKELEQYHKENGTYKGFYGEQEATQETETDTNKEAEQTEETEEQPRTFVRRDIGDGESVVLEQKGDKLVTVNEADIPDGADIVNEVELETEGKEETDKVLSENEISPIKKLGTGANVYFESEKYRVNDLEGDKISLNVGEQGSEVPLANIEFDSKAEAVYVAQRLEENAPEGLVNGYHNVNKIVSNYKQEYQDSKIGQESEVDADIDLGDIDILGEDVPETDTPPRKVTDEDIDNVSPQSDSEFKAEVKRDVKTAAESGSVANIPTKEIEVDAARFQFKEVTDKKKGINKKLSGRKWKPENAGVITVWKDPSDGKTYVVNGHHRLALAQEQGVDNINVFYLDAENASEARVKGAIQNIAEGQGTAIDAAKVIREQELGLGDLRESGLALSDVKAKEGLALAKLEGNVFQAVVAGDLKKNVGVIIGEEVENPNLQLELFKAVQGKNYTQGQIRVMAQDISNMKTEKKTSVNLFGETETEQADFENRSKFISNVRGLISRAKNLLGKTSNAKEFLEQYGNEIDAERSKGASQEAAQALTFFDAYRNSFPEISNILNKGYERIKNGEKKSKVERETANELIENLEGIIQRYMAQDADTGVSRSGDQQSDGRVEDQAAETQTEGETTPQEEVEEVTPEPTEQSEGEEGNKSSVNSQEAEALENLKSQPEPAKTPEQSVEPDGLFNKKAKKQTTGKTEKGDVAETKIESNESEAEKQKRKENQEVELDERPVLTEFGADVALEYGDSIPDGHKEQLRPHQRKGVNSIVGAFEAGKKAFLLADGAGAGKTRQLLSAAKALSDKGQKVLIVTTSKEVIAGSFQKDAKALGLDFKMRGSQGGFGNVEIVTVYKFRGMEDVNSYDSLLFDESQDASGLTSKTGQTLSKFKGYTVFSSATPFDTVDKTVYILPKLLGITEKEYLDRIKAKRFKRPGRGEEILLEETDALIELLNSLHENLLKEGVMLHRRVEFFGQDNLEFVLDGSDTVNNDLDIKSAEEGINNYYANKVKRVKLTAYDKKKGKSLDDKRRELNEQKRNELRTLNETYKVTPTLLDKFEKDIKEGRQIVVYGRNISDSLKFHFAEEGGESSREYTRPSFIYQIKKGLESRGISFEEVTGKNKKKDQTVERFQNGELKVVVVNQSGTTGINLNDVVGNAPRTMYIGGTPPNAIQLEQLKGRISRINNASKANIVYLRTNSDAEMVSRDKTSDKIAIMNSVLQGQEVTELKSVNISAAPKSKKVDLSDAGEGVNVTAVDYSSKAIALFGDTYPIKDAIKEIGGRFNKRLTNPETGKKEPGWIFPKSSADKVNELIENLNQEDNAKAEGDINEGDVKFTRQANKVAKQTIPNSDDSTRQEGLFTEEQFNTRDRSAEGKKVTDKTQLPDSRIGRIIKALLPTIKATGFNITLHESADSMMNAIAEANGGEFESSAGFIQGKEIHIYMGDGVKANTPLHELFHPVLAQIIRNNDDVYLQLVQSIKRSRSKTALDARVFMQQYLKEGQGTALEEMAVEALASEALVSLEESMADYANTNRSGFKRIIDKLLKLLGIKKPQREVMLGELLKGGSDYVSLGRAFGRALGTGQVIKGFGPQDSGFSLQQTGARFSRQEGVSPVNQLWVSNALEGLDKIDDNPRQPNQWVKELIKNGGRGTAQQLDWIGLEDYLKEWKRENKAKSIPKEVVERYIVDNDIKIEEVRKGNWDNIQENIDRLEEKYEVYINVDENPMDGSPVFDVSYRGDKELTDQEYEELEKTVKDELGASESGEVPRYESLSLEGGENYREVLLTMPTTFFKPRVSFEKWNENRASWGKPKGTFEEYKKVMSTPFGRDAYKSSHWDEANILAFMRMNERTLPNGERVLFLEEIQSDWAQEGKKKGFDDKTQDLTPKYRRLDNGMDFWEIGDETQKGEVYFDPGRKDATVYTARAGNKMQDFDNKGDAIKWAQDNIPKQRGVTPNMPYKKTDQWVGMSLRRAMQIAAERGLDRVAWVTGEQSAERYSLSKQVDKITTEKVKEVEGVYFVDIKMREGSEVNLEVENGIVREGRFKDKGLDEIVGKELAKNILENDSQVISGDGLKVGGEGMKTFYNSIVPKNAKKEARRFDKKAKVDVIDFEGQGGKSAGKQLSVAITDKMRGALRTGIPKFSRQGQPTREEATINNFRQNDAAKDKFIDLFDKLPYEPERIVKAAYKKFGVSFTQQQIDLIVDIVEARREQLKAEKKKDEQVKTEREQPQEGISFQDALDPDIKEALDKTERKEKDLTRYVRRLLRSRLIPKVLKKRLLGDPDNLTKRSLELGQIEQLANAYLADANTYEDYVAKLEELRKPYDQEITNEETLWGLTALHRLSVKFTQLNTSEGIDQAAEIHKIISDHLSRSGANLGAASPKMLPDSHVEFVAVGEIIRIHKQLKKETTDPLNGEEKIIPQERIEQIRQEVQQEYEGIIEGLREDLANARAKRASQAPEVKTTPKQKVRVRKAKGRLRKKANSHLKKGMDLLKKGRNQEVRFSKQGITPENANIDNLSEVSQQDTTALIEIALSTLYSTAGNITEARSLFTQLLKESGERSRIYALFGRKDVFDVIANSDAFQELSKETLREIAIENFKAAIDTRSGVLKNRDVVDKTVEEITNAVNAKKNARLTYTDKLPENISEEAQKLLDEAKKRAEKIVENYRTDESLEKGQAEVELQRVQDELQVSLDDAGEPIIAPDYNLATYTKPQNGDMISVGGKMFMYNGSNWMNTKTDRGATLKQREKIMDQFNSSFISPSKINEVRKGIVEGTISDSDLLLAWKSFKSRISVLPDTRQREQLNQFEEIIYNTFGLDITGNVETRVRVRNNAELANTTLNEIIDHFYLEAKGTDLPRVLMERLGMDEVQANQLAEDIKKVISEQARPKVKKILERFVESRKSVSSALDLALSGMLTMEDFKLAFGKEYNFSILDKNKVEEFKSLLNAYQTAELGVDEKKAAGDLQQFLIDNKNEHWIVKAKDLVVALIYNAYLNGVKPFFTAALGGAILVGYEMPMGLLKTVINSQPRIFLEAVKYGFKGLMTKGVREGVHIYKTGNSSRIYMNDPMNTHRKNLAQKYLVDNYNKFLAETKPRFSKEVPARVAALMFWSIPSLIYRMGSLVMVGDALVRSFGTDYNMAMKYYFDVISEGRQPTKDLLVAIRDKLGYDPIVDKERIDSIIKKELKDKEFKGPNAAADKKKYIETRTDEIIMESKRIAPIVAREMKEMDFGEGVKGKLRAKRYETRRSAELRSEFQDDGLASRASYLSQSYALMQIPEGILGAWANGVTSFLNQGSNRKNTTGLQLILSGLAQFLVTVHFPFVLKVGVNATNKALSYGGYNIMIKPLVHNIYKRLNVKTDNKEDLKRFDPNYIHISESGRADDVIYRERDAQERWNYMMESTVGILTTIALTAIMFDFEEDDEGNLIMKLSGDSPFRITGTGTGSYAKDKSLDDGFEAKAAQIKWDGKYRTIFNWDRHPVGGALAPLGYAHDKIYFNDGVELGGMALPKMLGSAILSGMSNTLFSNVIEDTQNLVEKVSTLLSTFDTTQKDDRKKAQQALYQELLLAGTTSEPAGNVLTGGAFTKWLNDMYAGMEGEALYQGESIHTKEFYRRANLMDMFGIDHGLEKRRHNQFGSPMIPEIGVFSDIGVADYAMFGESTKQPTDLEKAIKSNPKLKYAGYYASKVLSGVTAKGERLPMDLVNDITHNQSRIWADMFVRDKNRVKKAYESIDENDTSFEKTEVHDVQESFMSSLRNHAISEAKAQAVLDALDQAGHDYGGLSKFTTETESIAGISLGWYPMKRLNFTYVKKYMLKKGIAFNRDGELVEN